MSKTVEHYHWGLAQLNAIGTPRIMHNRLLPYSASTPPIPNPAQSVIPEEIQDTLRLVYTAPRSATDCARSGEKDHQPHPGSPSPLSLHPGPGAPSRKSATFSSTAWTRRKGVHRAPVLKPFTGQKFIKSNYDRLQTDILSGITRIATQAHACDDLRHPLIAIDLLKIQTT
jgi:hypothetical protein